jgi:hypothetical protein
LGEICSGQKLEKKGAGKRFCFHGEASLGFKITPFANKKEAALS